MRRRGLFLIAAGVTSAPVSAQFYSSPMPVPHHRHTSTPISTSTIPGIGPELGQVRGDIRAGERSDQLSHRQAKELNREAGEIDALEQRYDVNGLSDSERAELLNRIEVLRAVANAKRSGVIK